VTKASKAAIIAVTLVCVSILVVLTAAIIGVRSTEDVRVSGLMLLSTGVAAALLVLYFNLRARMRRYILAEREEQRKAVSRRSNASHNDVNSIWRAKGSRDPSDRWRRWWPCR
jgi:hypothetical protein